MKRKILFMPYDGEIEELIALIADTDKLALVVWTHEYSEKYVALFAMFCDDERVAQARDAAYLWAKGAMKMPEARRYILAAHRAAAESGNPVAEAAARAVAHAASTVHSARHAAGIVLYGLTALAKLYGKDSKEVEEEINRLTCGLVKVRENRDYESGQWAKFLSRKRVDD